LTAEAPNPNGPVRTWPPKSNVTPEPLTSPSFSFTNLAPAPTLPCPPRLWASWAPTAKLDALKVPVGLFEASRPSNEPLP
jgi:hypothetical protein